MSKTFKFSIYVETDMEESEAWDKLEEMLESGISHNKDLFDVEEYEGELK